MSNVFFQMNLKGMDDTGVEMLTINRMLSSD